MAHYVMSDLHGDLDRFHYMLEKINLKPWDSLYILGDVFDRGPHPVLLLREIMSKRNMHMLIGNHEYMCLQYFAPEVTEQDIRRWNRNGNDSTLKELRDLSDSEFRSVMDYLKNLPDYGCIDVKGHTYFLVHGFLGENRHDRVWNRPNPDTIVGLDRDCTLVIGHTPTVEYECPGSETVQQAYSDELDARGQHFKIFHAEEFIDIDCCCGYNFKASRLACLRLEDMKEFYV